MTVYSLQCTLWPSSSPMQKMNHITLRSIREDRDKLRGNEKGSEDRGRGTEKEREKFPPDQSLNVRLIGKTLARA